ncbi:MAG: hypothetical protein JSV88_16950 [Candidatus Aminicenantes bacterium]|nr:MAG: hypothetical protein JSV88_16950 [Candidatus Aminicenantes bacterium]
MTTHGQDNVNVRLSLSKIKDFIDAIPPEILKGNLAAKKMMADAGLAYFDSLFASKVGDVISGEPCPVGRPRIPDGF